LEASWEKMISDRAVPLKSRLVNFYREYAEVILTYEWIRLFMFAGLKDLGLNARYLKMLRERVFEKVIEELRDEYGRPSTAEMPTTVSNTSEIGTNEQLSCSELTGFRG
jgi:hypothetical protein